MLVEAPKFSKFLHGMASLYPDRCESFTSTLFTP